MSELVVDSTPDRGEFWANKGYNIVTIDVLRATSTIVVALTNGAYEVVPCAEVDEAMSYKGKDNYLLAGERKGEIIQGFDFSNSPYDLSKVNLVDKHVVLTTSDGTRLITKSSKSENVLVATTLNYGVIAQAILGIGGDWALIGAGSSGDFRPEDKVGCALVAKDLIKDGYFEPNDETENFTKIFSENWQNHILGSLSVTKLRKINRQNDVDFVINQANRSQIVPRANKENDQVSIKKYE